MHNNPPHHLATRTGPYGFPGLAGFMPGKKLLGIKRLSTFPEREHRRQNLALGVEAGVSHQPLAAVQAQAVELLDRVVGGIGTAGGSPSEAQVIKSTRPGVETIGNVPQTFAPSQLSKRHTDELLTTTEVAHLALCFVFVHQTLEGLAVHQVEHLAQDKSAGIHASKAGQNSNASHSFSFATCWPSTCCLNGVLLNRTPVK